MQFLELGFWGLALAVFWSYVGYPMLLTLIARLRVRTLRVGSRQPTVSMIIAAYNEERHIAGKIRTTFELDYPPEKLEIVVASDGCTDGTNDIVAGFEARGVRLVALSERSGKTAAQNAAALEASGEILVFTDSTTSLSPDAIARIVEPFDNPRVGCVAGNLEYRSQSKTAVGKGGSTYWRYERAIKRLESYVNSLIGVSGCLYAVRSDLYRDLAPDVISDLVIASDVYEQGHVSVLARGVNAFEDTHEDSKQEFAMRVRIIVRSIHALIRYRRMLNPFRHGFFAFQIFSHKVLRYLVPAFLIAALVINVVLARPGAPRAQLYGILLVLQILVYGAAALQALLLHSNRRVRFLHVPYYFVHANLAALWALIAYVRGDRMITWTPSR